MTDVFDRILLPLANAADAEATVRATDGYIDDGTEIVAIHVVEKAGGAPDKAGVEQREQTAKEAFAVVEEAFENVETAVYYGTSVADTIFEAADDHDVSGIVITPRGGGRLVRLLTGDVALHLVTESDYPVVVLPDPDEESSEGGE